jgi:UDP-perosamine 4-acetyltransferase
MTRRARIPVIGLGAGGHARVLIEALRFDDKFEVIGLLDSNPELAGTEVLGVPVLGTDDNLPDLGKKVQHFMVGLGSTGHVTSRIRLYERAVGLGMLPINVIHPRALISPSATFGDGIAVLAGAIINACVVLGVDVIVNTGAILEHDAIVGDHVHVATGARLCGGVQIGREAHIGAGSTIIQEVHVGDQAIVGAGAVVIHNVPPGVTVAGVPARTIRPPRGPDDGAV